MKNHWMPFAIYFAAALVVMLPLLGPGFILTLDMVFTPRLPMPEAVTSSYLFHAGLHYLNLLVPSDVLQKIMLLTILLLSGIGMHRLIKFLDPSRKSELWGTYAGGIFYMINPFTYSRFMAGQYAVLLGYALLPWFVRLLFAFGRRPQLRTALKLGCLATIVGIVSIHTLAALALLSFAAIVIALWRYRQRLRLYLRYGLAATILFLVASSYWLVPIALGKGATATMIGQFTAADSAAFATTGEHTLAKLGHIIQLQGFWAEERGLYLLPQDRMMLWGLLSLLVIGLVVWGGVALWRTRPLAAVLLAGSSLVAMLIATGLASQVTLLAGLREPHKLVALVALTYSVLLALGIKGLLASLARRGEALQGATAVLVVMLPLLLTKTMLFGFDGQLTPRQYPADWHSLNHYLEKDTGSFAVVFLPWHQYMSFQFAGRIIASPAPAFFTKPTFASTDPELGGATSGRVTDYQQKLHNVITAPDKAGFAEKLAALNVKYLILAKEFDYSKYDYLNRQPLTQVKQYQSITLYQNPSWRKL